MQRLLDRAAHLIREARDLAPGEVVPRLKEALGLLEAVRPGPERDGMIGLAYLRLAQAQKALGQPREAERAFMLGYSYARTSREDRVRRFAEKLKEEFSA